MSIERRERIAELTWNRREAELRTSLFPKLIELGKYEFLGKKTTTEMGDQFWSIVKKLEYVETDNFEKVLAVLKLLYHDKQVLWFHRYANETGVIVVKLGTLINMLARLLGEFGPDLAFAGSSFEFGLFFEQGESDLYLRWWGGEKEIG
jgi:hypothetical protein